MMSSSVNSAPSSGCRVRFPPIAATARGCRSGVALPPASPLSRVCPRRWGGSHLGDLAAPPALSLRGWGWRSWSDRPLRGGCGKETPLADEYGFTSVSFVTSSTLFMPADFRSKDVARGFTGIPLKLLRAVALAPSSQPKRDGLGCFVPQCYSPKIAVDAQCLQWRRL